MAVLVEKPTAIDTAPQIGLDVTKRYSLTSRLTCANFREITPESDAGRPSDVCTWMVSSGGVSLSGGGAYETRMD